MRSRSSTTASLPAGQEAAVFDAAVKWFADLDEVADELYVSGSALHLS